ncbi:bifunctional 2',3'-cyclic-nucleotide 2'-phosphodiesterase/3'-nucleotidase [Chryseomicrobium palamuruense]|uniref:Bifunctional 2',3'-cyclic-nucleotide 2'-phosphodiesterase/3'-nucleotidase n=1 Tax=Chryseomicrobium palamuruense TaxID=682973 RepID=A0ABV8UV61_9BACL
MNKKVKVTSAALVAGLVLSSFGPAISAAPVVDVTRGEYVKSLITAMDVELGDGSSVKFSDVESSLKPYVEKALELGLTKGKNSKLFGTTERVTREQAFVMTVRGLEADKTYPATVVEKFKDHKTISRTLLPEVSKGVGMGFFLGYPDKTIQPGKLVAPGEMKRIVDRFLKEYSPSQTNTTVAMQILGTTDIHTNIMPYDYYKDNATQSLGLAKTATLIKQARQENPNSILVDNGDLIQGTPFGSYVATVDPLKDGQEHPSITTMELLGYDAGTLGNHEFNYGLDFLDEVLDDADYPVINANVKDATSGERLFQPYVVETKTFKDSTGKDAQVKVGITGIVPPDILKWDKSHLEGKVTVQDSVHAVEWAVKEMKKEGADVVVVLAHSGFGDDIHTVGEEDVGYLLTKVKGVDALVTGHAHSTFPDAKNAPKLPNVDVATGLINGVPTVMPGKYGSHLGVIDLELVKQGNGWIVSSSSSELRAISSDVTAVDQEIVEAVKTIHEKTLEYVREAVGTITSDIHSYFAQVQDDPSIQIVTDAQKWYMEKNIAQIAAANPEYANLPILSAGAPFKAGTRSNPDYYTFVPKGEIAIKNVADLYLYDNTLAALIVTGEDVKEWLEMSAGQFKQISTDATGEQQLINTDFRSYNYDVIDGVTYEIDVTQPAKYSPDGVLANEDASRILNLMYDGKPIDLNQKFIVATNNYRANGLFPGVRDKEAVIMFPDENRQAIIDYILEKKTIDPSADNNWKFAPLPSTANVVFESSPKAKAAITTESGITYVGEGTDGFSKYQLKK